MRARLESGHAETLTCLRALVEAGRCAIALETEQVLRDLIRELGDVARFAKIIDDTDRRDPFEVDEARFDVDPVLDRSKLKFPGRKNH